MGLAIWMMSGRNGATTVNQAAIGWGLLWGIERLREYASGTGSGPRSRSAACGNRPNSPSPACGRRCPERAEEGRGGKEGVSTGRTRWEGDESKKNTAQIRISRGKTAVR